MRSRSVGSVSSVDQPPQTHPHQPERDARHAQPPAPHAESRVGLDDLGLVLLQLGHARHVAVRGEAEEGTAPCERIDSSAHTRVGGRV